MKNFEYVRPGSVAQAVQALDQRGAMPLAGGMDMVPGMQDNVIDADRVVNLKSIQDDGIRGIRETDGGLVIGALTTLTEIAEHPVVQSQYAALAEATLEVGSPQIRNVGTLGGNLCQRPRCWYFRSEHYKCLKKGGPRCFAADDEAENQYNAILGGGPAYIVHPSNCASALVALNATFHVAGPDGPRAVHADDFFVLPTERLLQENVLRQGEIVTHVEIPEPPDGSKSAFLETSERAGFDWGISGAAVAGVVRDGVITSPRIVLYAVAPIPWRATDAEAEIDGKPLNEGNIRAAGEAALAGAEPLSNNGYKVPLTKTMVRRALARLA
ncbi:xanthine dehydrogenase family protein subunit M [Candidatus Poribacteria bacterium]|jgi:xanthine dehydrogenase YagS FAD-binding subunit|nr:xanthine dehydrogenase family protein subunit M [Candidatus Poribacteria bacterium]MBT5532784.1 xanthine dehydrogenase family protein subunit M [Candidatus Poribacteria bacterium]MBT5715040.1 xanthine dehydrogenase family protein subunit M [Candidatus Poribacteria bacterium]MBT7100165.1 xanthine dehydrogenase family protein subunit M [Candidatus Poribacteria bacterium]MBT7806001.1 xanthine dehydrogenase family protein subunit M [Candidatus Poribacteria bacterium]